MINYLKHPYWKLSRIETWPWWKIQSLSQTFYSLQGIAFDSPVIRCKIEQNPGARVLQKIKKYWHLVSTPWTDHKRKRNTRNSVSYSFWRVWGSITSPLSITGKYGGNGDKTKGFMWLNQHIICSEENVVRMNSLGFESTSCHSAVQTPVVQRADNSIQRITHYPMNEMCCKQ